MLETPKGEPAYRVDYDEWPLVVVRVGRPMTPKELRAYLELCDRDILARGERYAVILVTEHNKRSMNSETMKIQSDYLNERREIMGELCVASALVTNTVSPIVQFTVSMMMSILSRHPTPWKMFGTEEAARKWALGLLQQQGA